MTDQETINVNLQRQIDMQNSRIDMVSTNVNSLVQELREFKNETREQNKIRAEELREFKNETREQNKKLAEEIREIRIGLNDIGNHVRNMSLTTLIGIAAMVIAVILK